MDEKSINTNTKMDKTNGLVLYSNNIEPEDASENIIMQPYYNLQDKCITLGIAVPLNCSYNSEYKCIQIDYINNTLDYVIIPESFKRIHLSKTLIEQLFKSKRPYDSYLKTIYINHKPDLLVVDNLHLYTLLKDIEEQKIIFDSNISLFQYLIIILKFIENSEVKGDLRYIMSVLIIMHIHYYPEKALKLFTDIHNIICAKYMDLVPDIKEVNWYTEIYTILNEGIDIYQKFT